MKKKLFLTVLIIGGFMCAPATARAETHISFIPNVLYAQSYTQPKVIYVPVSKTYYAPHAQWHSYPVQKRYYYPARYKQHHQAAKGKGYHNAQYKKSQGGGHGHKR